MLKTRCKDKHGNTICVGDILFVDECPGDDYVGGSISFDGIVTLENGRAMVTYHDIGEEEAFYVSRFPIQGREIANERQRHEYWRTAYLGGEPDPRLWKEELYRDYFGGHDSV